MVPRRSPTVPLSSTVLAASFVAALAPAAGGVPGTSTDEPGLFLDWEADSDCDGTGVRPAVERLLGTSLEHAASPGLRSRVRLREVDDGLHRILEVQHGGERSERELHVATCAEAVDAVALVLALAIDPNAGTRGEPDEALGPSSSSEADNAAPGSNSEADNAASRAPGARAALEPLPPPAALPDAKSSSERKLPSSRPTALPDFLSQHGNYAPVPLTLRFGVRAGASLGALPEASPGLGLAVGVDWGT